MSGITDRVKSIKNKDYLIEIKNALYNVLKDKPNTKKKDSLGYKHEKAEGWAKNNDLKYLYKILQLHLNDLTNEKNKNNKVLYNEHSCKLEFFHNGTTWACFERGNSVKQMGKDMCPHVLGEKIHPRKDYPKLVAFLIFSFFEMNGIDLPGYTFNGKTVEVNSLGILYDVLTMDYLELSDNWEDIYNNQNQLLYYLFNITPSDDEAACKRVLSQWNIPDLAELGRRESKNAVYDKAQKIIDAAKKQPMYEYLIETDPLKHKEEVREILKHMVTFNVCSQKITLEPPVQAVVRWIKDIAEEATKEEEYTTRDFLYMAGCLAQQASDGEHTVENPDFPDKYTKELSERIFEGIKKSYLCDPNASSFKLRIRPFRLVLTGMDNATKANREDENWKSGQKIMDCFPKIEDKNLVKIGEDFHKKHDAYCFCVLSYLYHLDEKKRDDELEWLCQKASDFAAENRSVQICCIYLLSNVLASSLLITAEQRKRIFQCAYGKSLYGFQASYWKYIDERSSYYKKTAESSMEEACLSLKQPYYFFLYGLMNEGSNNIASAEDILKYAAAQQCQSWYPQSRGSETEKKHKKILEIFNNIIKRTNNEKCSRNDIPKLMYAVQYLGYAIANYLNDNETDSDVRKILDKIDVCKLLLISDFYLRENNDKYPDNMDDGFLLCGTARVMCLMGNEVTFDFDPSCYSRIVGNKTKEDIKGQYMKWLEKEQGRYKYFMAKLCYHAGFLEKANWEEYKAQAKNGKEYNNNGKEVKFLDYDHVENW